MDRERAERVLAIFEKRGDVEPLASAGPAAAAACLDRARDRLSAVELLLDADLWESAFTNAYDAYRMAAESIVLALGYRVPAVAGAHRITIDIAQAAVSDGQTDAFAGAAAERFRTGRHEAEYFDPDRPVEKTEADARWALTLILQPVFGGGGLGSGRSVPGWVVGVVGLQSGVSAREVRGFVVGSVPARVLVLVVAGRGSGERG